MLELPRVRKRFRRKRKPYYEVVCKCNAYSYPHRFGGGYCTGASLVYIFWENGMCGDCRMKTFDDFMGGVPACQVLHGREGLEYCEQLQEFLRKHEAYTKKLYKR